MKFAVFGDIHGNIEALRAAYQEALSAKAGKISRLGDLGGYSPFVNEVVEFLIEHHIEGVQGNYDKTVANVTLIDITEDNVNVEFLRVPYDVRKASTAIIASGLPPYFAEKLTEAR